MCIESLCFLRSGCAEKAFGSHIDDGDTIKLLKGPMYQVITFPQDKVIYWLDFLVKAFSAQ